MLAYFGTDVDRGEGAIGVDVDGVMGIGAERGDKEWRYGGFEDLGPGNVVEELAVDVEAEARNHRVFRFAARVERERRAR